MKEKSLQVLGLIIIAGFVGLAVYGGLHLPSHTDAQLEQLKQMNRQLEKIQESNDRIENNLNEYQKTSPTPKPTASAPVVQGQASVYTEAGCLGCDEEQIMANGEKLNDDRPTIALACRWAGGRCLLALPLGTRVTVSNVETGKAVVATFTDTGGFDKYNRVADLSLATAKAIGCDGLCDVKIWL